MKDDIVVLGMGDRDKLLGFPNREDLEVYIRDIYTHYQGRFRYTKQTDAGIVVLSWGGWACGHFEIQDKTEPSPTDDFEYPGTQVVYIISSRTLYLTPVRLHDMGVRVRQPPLPITHETFQAILDAAGEKQVQTEIPSREAQRKLVWALIQQRQGQGQFRVDVLKAYGSRCAISGFDVEAGLDAAHIHPYAEDGSYKSSNGLLLRSDLHNLFDLDLLAIDPEMHTVRLAKRLLKSKYGELDNLPLRLPIQKNDWPDPIALQKRWKDFKNEK